MSAFDKRFNQSAATKLHRYFGETATYSPPAGSTSTDAVTLSHVIFTDETTERRYDDEGVRFVTTRKATLIVDPAHALFCGLETPQARGQITFDGSIYVIDTPPESSAHGVSQIHLERHQAAAVTRPDYYRKG